MLPVTDNPSLYGPNENLIDRNNLQVSLDELDDHGFGTDDYKSFESGLGTTPPTSILLSSHVIDTFSSTPIGAPSYLRVHQSQSQLPVVSLQPHIIGMLQEQQAFLHQIINEKEEMSKSVKKNNKRITTLEAHLNDQS